MTAKEFVLGIINALIYRVTKAHEIPSFSQHDWDKLLGTNKSQNNIGATE